MLGNRYAIVFHVERLESLRNKLLLLFHRSTILLLYVPVAILTDYNIKSSFPTLWFVLHHVPVLLSVQVTTVNKCPMAQHQVWGHGDKNSKCSSAPTCLTYGIIFYVSAGD